MTPSSPSRAAGEPLQVSNLKHPALFRRKPNQLVRLGEVFRDRLFNEDVHAMFEEGLGDFVVERRGHGDGNGIHLAEQLAVVKDGRRAMLFRNRVGAFAVGVRDGGECRSLETGIFFGMKPTEIPDPNHGRPDLVHPTNPVFFSTYIRLADDTIVKAMAPFRETRCRVDSS